MSEPESTTQDSAPQSSSASVRKAARPTANLIAWSVALLLVLALCSFWLIASYTAENLLRQQTDSLGQTLAEQTATQITELVLANDLVSLNVVLSSLIADSAVQRADVINISGDLLATATSSRSRVLPLFELPWRLQFSFGEYRAPIELANALAGEVRLEIDQSYIEAGLINSFILITVTTLLLAALAFLLIRTSFQNLISFPTRLLAFALSNIRKGEIDTCPEPTNNNELSIAIRQYNATAEYLARNAFLNNINERLPNDNGEDYQTEAGKLDVTLLCIRMSNFAYLASTLSEDQLIALLNKFYFLSSKICQLYNGEVSYCADGELVINFGLTEAEQEHAFYAICAGQLLLLLAADIGDVDGRSTGAKFRAAVHCGPTVTGLYSPLSQASNNLMGKTLDLTRAICDECPDNSLLVSEACLEQAGAGSRVDGQDFTVVDDDAQIIASLCNEPMADYQSLLERQALHLVTLYSKD